jgi:hypothetical protein
MAEPLHEQAKSFSTDAGEPLIALVTEENGREVVRYFADDAAADAAAPADSIQAARDLAGAWSDLDWDDMLEALDHSSFR